MNTATADEPAQELDPTTVDKSGTRVRRMFGEISSRYDFMNHFLSGGVDYYWRWQTVRTIRPTGEAPILDVCTGTGDLAFSWWKKAGRRVPVIGSDFTHEMLQLANDKRHRKTIKPGDRSITFLEADTQQLPFPADHFQIVSVAFGLRNVSDTNAGLREMIRVCKPGGSVVVLEFSLPKNRLVRSAYLWYFKNILPKLGQLLARNKQSAYNYLPDSVSEFPYGKALADRMQNCGLESVKWQALTFGISTLYYGQKPKTESTMA